MRVLLLCFTRCDLLYVRVAYVLFQIVHVSFCGFCPIPGLSTLYLSDVRASAFSQNHDACAWTSPLLWIAPGRSQNWLQLKPSQLRGQSLSVHPYLRIANWLQSVCYWLRTWITNWLEPFCDASCWVIMVIHHDESWWFIMMIAMVHHDESWWSSWSIRYKKYIKCIFKTFHQVQQV